MTVIGLGSFNTFSEAYRSMLAAILEHGAKTAAIRDPLSVGSRFGTQPRGTRELICTGFSLSNPRARLIASKVRGMHPDFAIANTLWTLRGFDDIEMIGFYNQRASSFSDDGVTLAGALGRRLFRCDDSCPIRRAIDRLKEDTASRRAVVPIFGLSDLSRSSRDVPCSIAMQFLIRDKRLTAITFMRSQSAAMVLPYDLFLFTMIQEVVALELQLEIGEYHHVCGSAHLYEDEIGLAEKIRNETATADGSEAMLSMTISPLADSAVFEGENELRRRLMGRADAETDDLLIALDPYWREMLRALTIGAKRRMGVAVEETEYQKLSPALRKAFDVK